MSTCDKLTGTLTLGATMSGGLLVAKGDKGDPGEKGDPGDVTEEYRNLASQIAQNASDAQTSATNAKKTFDDTKEFTNQAKSELNKIKTDTSSLKDEANTSAVNAKASEDKAKEYADNLQASTDDISKLKSDLSKVNNTTDNPITAGMVWTSTESGAGWREPTGGKAGDFELLVSQELAETVNSVSFEFGKAVNEIYMQCECPKIIAVSPCHWSNGNGKQIGLWPSTVLSTNTDRYVMTHFYKIDNVKWVCDTRYGTNNATAGNINTSYYSYSNDGISKLIGKYANGLVSGTKFTIWGR